MTISELKDLIVQWAQDKDLLKEENAPRQYLKFLSEVGETADAILENDVPEIKDGFGDIAVTIIILAQQLHSPLKLDMFFAHNFELHPKTLEDAISYVGSGFVSEYAIESLYFCAKSHGYELEECLNLAWNEIKDRTGKTVNGTFIKS